jgi:RNA polymerase sigma-70 factor (ECF subfamily)
MSSSQRNDFVLTDYARKLIRFKARQLCRLHSFCKSDEEDLQQELWLAVVNQAGKFDPARASLDTFIDRVVNTAVAMILRDRQRQKRSNGFQTVSLDVAPADGHGSEPLAAKVSQDDLARRIGTEPADEAERRETAEAVASALDKLPDELRDVCRRVMSGSISAAAEDLETSRRQIRNALASARPYFEQAGVDKG